MFLFALFFNIADIKCNSLFLILASLTKQMPCDAKDTTIVVLACACDGDALDKWTSRYKKQRPQDTVALVLDSILVPWAAE